MITIINDSRDENAKGRQVARAQHLFQAPVSFVGVNDDIEASGNVIDMLDAYEGEAGTILVNVAPRNGSAQKWENGTPFGYFWYKNTLVVATVDGYTLSLVKKLRITSDIYVLDLESALRVCERDSIIFYQTRKDTEHTQFRSFRFLPLAAYALRRGSLLPFTQWDISEVDTMPRCIWWIDSFGNVKTSLTYQELLHETEGTYQTEWGTFPIYESLRDVPDKQNAFISGSSGLEDHRFVEFVGQGFSAASAYYLNVGDPV